MKINLVHFCIFWLNAMPVKTCISMIYSPQEIICCQKVDVKKWCQLMFGDYVEVHEENPITNSMKPRTRPAICMGPSGNSQGSIKFMCIKTGIKVIRRNYTRLPMPHSEIKKVEKLVDRDRAEDGINFRNRKKEIFDWKNEEFSDPERDVALENAPYPDIVVEFPGVEISED